MIVGNVPVVVYSYTLAPSVQNGWKQKNSRTDLAKAILDQAGARFKVIELDAEGNEMITAIVAG